MNTQDNISRFEQNLSYVKRPGMEGLLNYIRRSDFYTAPASTRYHLSCPGGLLQHSLNVLDVLRGMLPADPASSNAETRLFQVGGAIHTKIPDESIIMAALTHDICKTHFYQASTRNVKNEETGKWEKVPTFTVADRMPLGHGPKSVMLIKEHVKLTNMELYAIWHHMGTMGLSGPDLLTWQQAADKYPLVWLLHSADMIATHYVEGATDNRTDIRPIESVSQLTWRALPEEPAEMPPFPGEEP